MPTQAVALVLASLLAAAPTRASLEVDASALGEAGPLVEARLTTGGETVLRDGDVLPAQGPGDAIISVRVDTLGDAVGYRFWYTVTRGGELVDGTRGSAECRLCNEAELGAQIEASIARLVPRLASEPDADAPARPRAPRPSASTAAQGAPAAGRWRVGPTGGAGIVLTGTGALALGLGAGLAIAEPVLLQGNAGRNSTVAVAGLAVAVVGAALAATGVALMLVDRKRSRTRTSARWDGRALRF